jgi:transcriptional regulator with XRE-family HTH domain
VIQLQEQRKQCKLTQEQLAAKLGCTAHVVWLWESGKIKHPRSACTHALEEFFGLPIEQLFEPVNENSPDTVSVEAA